MALYDKLLVTTDFSEAALPGIDEAARIARATGSKVVLVYVVEDRVPPMLLGGAEWKEIVERQRSKATSRLEEYASQHLPGCDVESTVRVGLPAEQIVEVARESGVDVIVISSHGRGVVGRLLLGSTAERVLHHAPCPVLVVRPDGAPGKESES